MTFPLYFGDTLIFHSAEQICWNGSLYGYSGILHNVKIATSLETLFTLTRSGNMLLKNPLLGLFWIHTEDSALELTDVDGIWKVKELCFSQR